MGMGMVVYALIYSLAKNIQLGAYGILDTLFDSAYDILDH